MQKTKTCKITVKDNSRCQDQHLCRVFVFGLRWNTIIYSITDLADRHGKLQVEPWPITACCLSWLDQIVIGKVMPGTYFTVPPYSNNISEQVVEVGRLGDALVASGLRCWPCTITSPDHIHLQIFVACQYQHLSHIVCLLLWQTTWNKTSKFHAALYEYFCSWCLTSVSLGLYQVDIV